MELPREIYLKIEKLLEGHSIKSLKEITNRIIDNYKNESGRGKSLINDELSAKVYAAYRLPATFSAIHSALSHTLELYDGEITSLTDVGAGSGAASFAASSLLSLSKIECLEKDPYMSNVGKVLSNGLNFSWKDFDLVKDELSSSDLIIAGYLFNELSSEDVIRAIKKLWNHTNKVLLVVEPGTPVGYSIIKNIRDTLINEGGYVISPCPHMDKCPMKEHDWCHFVTRVNRSKLQKDLKGGDAPYEDEKFSYIAFSKTPVNRCECRVLRHPQISKSLVQLTCCCKDGINNIQVRKNEKEKYKLARKIHAGDKFL